MNNYTTDITIDEFNEISELHKAACKHAHKLSCSCGGDLEIVSIDGNRAIVQYECCDKATHKTHTLITVQFNGV